MILLSTIATGLALFHLLIAWEAFRQLCRDYNEAMRINWFVLPRRERKYMRRQEGVMTA